MGRGSDEVLRDLAGLREQVYRLFDEQAGHAWGGREPGSAQWTPTVDIYDTGAAFILAAEVPGVEQDDIHVEVTDDILVLRGERPAITPDPSFSYHRIERPGGLFQRVFRLPTGVDSGAVTAVCRDGVLRVTMPKLKEAIGRPIAVRLGE